MGSINLAVILRASFSSLHVIRDVALGSTEDP